MNKIIEKIKDILYDSFDYVVMLAIVAIVVGIIGWRLDILFAKDIDKPSTDKDVVVVGPGKNVHNEPGNEDGDDTALETDIDTEKDTDIIIEENKDNETVEPENPVTNKEIKVIIPAGSLPGKIASILVENGLIDNSKNFIAKAVELKLDTKLKSGTFTIPVGSSYEEILSIITK